jgi:hypothetical protein
MSKSKEIFTNAEKDVQNLVKKILALVRRNRSSRGSAVEQDIVREVKEIST